MVHHLAEILLAMTSSFPNAGIISSIFLEKTFLSRSFFDFFFATASHFSSCLLPSLMDSLALPDLNCEVPGVPAWSSSSFTLIVLSVAIYPSADLSHVTVFWICISRQDLSPELQNYLANWLLDSPINISSTLCERIPYPGCIALEFLIWAKGDKQKKQCGRVHRGREMF